MRTVRWDLNFAAAGLFPGRGGRRCVRRGRSVGRMLGLCVTFCFVCLFSGWVVVVVVVVVERNVEEHECYARKRKYRMDQTKEEEWKLFFSFSLSKKKERKKEERKGKRKRKKERKNERTTEGRKEWGEGGVRKGRTKGRVKYILNVPVKLNNHPCFQWYHMLELIIQATYFT